MHLHAELWISDSEYNSVEDEFYYSITEIKMVPYIQDNGEPDLNVLYEFLPDYDLEDLRDIESVVNGEKVRRYELYDYYEIGGRYKELQAKNCKDVCPVSEINFDELTPDVVIVGNEIFEIMYWDDKETELYKQTRKMLQQKLQDLKDSGKGYLITIDYHC